MSLKFAVFDHYFIEIFPKCVWQMQKIVLKGYFKSYLYKLNKSEVQLIAPTLKAHNAY